MEIIADFSYFKLILKTEMKNLLQPKIYFYYGKINIQQSFWILAHFFSLYSVDMATSKL